MSNMQIPALQVNSKRPKVLRQLTCTHLPSYHVSQKSHAIQNSPVLQARSVICESTQHACRQASSTISAVHRKVIRQYSGSSPSVRDTPRGWKDASILWHLR